MEFQIYTYKVLGTHLCLAWVVFIDSIEHMDCAHACGCLAAVSSGGGWNEEAAGSIPADTVDLET